MALSMVEQLDYHSDLKSALSMDGLWAQRLDVLWVRWSDLLSVSPMDHWLDQMSDNSLDIL